jgi:hypothetical protein
LLFGYNFNRRDVALVIYRGSEMVLDTSKEGEGVAALTRKQNTASDEKNELLDWFKKHKSGLLDRVAMRGLLHKLNKCHEKEVKIIMLFPIDAWHLVYLGIVKRLLCRIVKQLLNHQAGVILWWGFSGASSMKF